MTKEDAFTRLWDEHSTAVWAFAARRVGRVEADDVVMDTFLVAWRRQELDVPAWWLLKVAHNVIGDRYRAEARRIRLVDRLRATAATVADPSNEVDGTLELAEVFAGLDRADQETLALVYFDDLTPSEAARVIGCSAPAFRMRLMRARRALRHEHVKPLFNGSLQ